MLHTNLYLEGVLKMENDFLEDVDHSRPVVPSLKEMEVQGKMERVKLDAMTPNGGPKEMNTKNYSPKVTFWGCGGFGINQTRLLPGFLDYPNASFRIIDTSKANTHKQEIDSRIDVRYVGDDGHGKVRGTNLEVLQQKMDQMVFVDDNESDIDVVIFSLSGGSGSVVGPLIVKALTKKDKPVIVITVADANSTVDCENSIKTIKTIENFAKNSYVNMILFDNSISGRNAVDDGIRSKIDMFMRAINLNDIRELDKSDIVIAMRPYHHKILSEVRGLYVMRIGNDCPFCYDDEEITTCHSCINVGDSVLNSNIHSSIHYEGTWVDNHKPIVMRFGLSIPNTFIKRYDGILKRSQAASSSHNIQSTIKVEGSEEHSTGIVL